MKRSTVKIFVNGFGRIGRSVTRILLSNPACELVGINDVVNSVENLAYLLKYDSNYGRVGQTVEASEKNKRLVIDGHAVPVFNHRSLSDIDWSAVEPDVVIDSSGVQGNVDDARKLKKVSGLKGVVVTHAPSVGTDRTIIMGVNQQMYQPNDDFVVSSSICDANAISHVLQFLDATFGISAGSITTLHPWLGYQNLTDGAVAGQSDPGHFWPDFSLGRSSVGAVIPKNTTAVSALTPVLPDVAPKLNSFSYRIPTAVVTTADMTIVCEKEVRQKDLLAALEKQFAHSKYVSLNRESLVSVDYQQSPYSAIVDMQWVSVSPGNVVKVIVWYDNEWGYANRAVDVAALMVEKQGKTQ